MDGLRRAATAVAMLLALAAGTADADVRVLRADAASRLLPRSCMRLTPLRHGRVEAVVRTGRLIRSVTLRADASRRVYGCDATAVRAEGRTWCNVETGALRRGRIADPRLGLLCSAADGARVATAWVSPLPGARTLVVRDGARRDRYAAAGGLPIRIAATHGVEYASSAAVFVVAQLDRHGRLLARTRLRARVAG